MLPKLSVKKPLTIVVAVLIVIVLGFLSFIKMPTNLLPDFELPYVAVITAYPGASPEKVELMVTKPIESTLSTTGGVEKVTSISSEGSSMVVFSFSYNTNMDSATIDMSNKIDMVKSQLDSGVSTPVMMQINPDMLPVMVASVDIEGKTLEETSQIVTDTVIPTLERVDGVASIDSMGILEKQIGVTLNQEKIDAINDRILTSVDSGLAETKQKLDEGQKQLDGGKAQYESMRKEKTQELAEAGSAISDGKQKLQEGLNAIDAGITEATAQRAQLQALRDTLDSLQTGSADLVELSEKLHSFLSNLRNGLQESAQKLSGMIDTLPEGNAILPFLKNLRDSFVSVQEMCESALAALSQSQNPEEVLAELDRRLAAGVAECDSVINALPAQKNTLEAQLVLLEDQQKQLEAGKLTMSEELAKASLQLETAEKQLEEGRSQFETARDAALEKADLSGVITQEMISNILAADNFSMPAGFLTEDGKQYAVKVGDLFQSQEELENLELMDVDAEGVGMIRLSDVADIAPTDNASELYAKINGNDGILLTFQKQSTASTTEVSERLRAAMEKLQQENEGMRLTTLNDQGVYINIVIDTVLQNLLMGGVLAILILFLFLRNIRPTFIVALSIPISLLLAVVAMYFTGVDLNIISLAGLALGVGMLVDNSIVVIENIYRLRTEGVPSAKAAVQGAKQVSGAIFASTLTTICVFLPIVFTEGISRELFTDMGLTIAYSLLASLLIALSLVPTLSSTILRNAAPKKQPLIDRFINGYGKQLAFTLKHRAVPLILVAVLFGVALFGATRMGTAMIPESDNSEITVSLQAGKDSSVEETRALGDQVSAKIQGMPGVETVGAMQSGKSGNSSNQISMYVVLKKDRDRTSQQICQDIQDATAGLGCEISAVSSNDMMSMGGSGLEINIRGDDLDELQRISHEVSGIVSGIEGTQKVTDGTEESNSETRITVDKNKALSYGLTVAQVYQEIAQAIQSETTATTLSLESMDYPVIVAKDPQNNLTRETLGEYMLSGTQNGETVEVALSDIASITEASGLSSINHENFVRSMTVSAQIAEGYNIGLVSRELEKKLADYEVPDGYTVEITGENETINNTIRDLLMMVGLAILLIYFIMVAQFQSFLSPFIVMFTIPLAFTGGLLGLWIFGYEISTVSLLGLLVLAGIVVNNGIVFVDYANQLRRSGMERREALVETGKRRIRPILMTALTTILGLFTMALGIGTGADMFQPMAIVIIFGLTYATLLTLFIVPILCDIFQKKPPKNIDVGDGDSQSTELL